MHDAVANWSNLGAFVAGLADGDLDLLSRSMVDTIIEPVRSSLIPHFEEVRSRSLDAGAFGGGISGSGPSMFMLSRDQQTAEAVKGAIASVFGNSNVEFNIYISKVAKAGVRLADQNRYCVFPIDGKLFKINFLDADARVRGNIKLCGR